MQDPNPVCGGGSAAGVNAGRDGRKDRVVCQGHAVGPGNLPRQALALSSRRAPRTHTLENKRDRREWEENRKGADEGNV